MSSPSASIPAQGLAVCFNSSYLGFCTHAGFLAGLYELGVRPSHVSGASAGALVAGLYAGGMEPGRLLELLTGRELMKTFFEPAFLIRGAAMTLNRPGFTGLVNAERTVGFLQKHMEKSRIEDCSHPRLAIAVTNLSRARTEVVTRGPLAEFIVASCAFPVVCSAREVEGSFYWDGGIANSAPIDPWIEDPAIRTILIHQVATEKEEAAGLSGRGLSVAGACSLSHQIICQELLREKIRRAESAGKKVIVLRSVTPSPAMFRTRIKMACAERGRNTALGNAAVFKYKIYSI